MTVPPLYSLFHEVDESARAHLLASGLGKPRPGTKNVDLFAGGGGWGLAARRLGVEVHYAINHSKVAIATHAQNFPSCVHHQGDAWKVRPRSVVGNDEIDVLFASAACTTHSNAAGGIPISKRVHMLGWCIARWIHDVRPRLILVENVVEWLKWGPLVQVRDANGRVVRDERGKIVQRPNRAEEGTHFKRWVRQCKRLGYVVEWRVMDAADYGEASRRKRLFVQMRRDGAPIVWPEVTHGLRICGREVEWASKPACRIDSGERAMASRQSDVLAPRYGKTCPTGAQARDEVRVGSVVQGESVVRGHGGLAPYRTAADIIDWSDLGRSLFVRKATRQKPFGLAPKSIGRICEGISRFVLNDADPFLLSTVYGDGWHVRSARDTMPTQTTRQDLGMCVPVIAPQNTDVYGRPTNEPGPTITTKGHQSLMSPVLQAFRGNAAPRSPDEPIPTITAGNGPGRGAGAAHAIGIGTPVLTSCGGPKRQPDRVAAPMQTLLTREDRGIATPVMIRQNHGETPCAPVGAPLSTVTTQDNRNTIATPVMAAIGYGERDGQRPRCQTVEEPTTTIVGAGKQGLATPVLAYANQGQVQTGEVGQPLRTVVAGGLHAGLASPVVAEYYGSSTTAEAPDSPLGTVVTHDRFGVATPIVSELSPAWAERARTVGKMLKAHLGDRVTLNADGMVEVTLRGIVYVIVDVLFRMLKVHELAAAMGFPPDYKWPLGRGGKVNQREAVKLIGNAISVRNGAALLSAMLPELGRDRLEAVA